LFNKDRNQKVKLSSHGHKVALLALVLGTSTACVARSTHIGTVAAESDDNCVWLTADGLETTTLFGMSVSSNDPIPFTDSLYRCCAQPGQVEAVCGKVDFGAQAPTRGSSSGASDWK